MKIAIVHDHLGFRGGGERTALLLALRLKADFITAYADPKTFSSYQEELGSRLKKLSVGVIKFRVIRFFWLRFIFWKKRKVFREYDILIASGQTATEAVAFYARPKTLKIVYTHSTPRRVFDQFKLSRRMYPLILRPAYSVFALFWKWLYLKSIRRFDINIANSKNVRQRIRDHTGGDANCVIWPPILTNEFKWQERGDYFFSWGRVDESKRIELIVRAFKKMPDEKLVIASGGPRLEKVRDIAEGAKNITILGWVSDEKLKELVGRCRAAVYIPIDEDAGITHLEANAAGKPYLGACEGGLIESTIDGRTGILVKADPDESDIISAVKTMTPAWCAERRKDCEEHAKTYDAEIFFSRVEALIRKNNPEIPLLGVDASRCEDPRRPGAGIMTGVEVYSARIISHLIASAAKKNIRLCLYTPRPIPSFPAEIQKVIPGGKGWTRRNLAAELKNSPPDFFFTPAYFIPKNAPEKSFAVIHDIIFKSSPEKYSLMERLAQNYALNQNLKSAKKIITVSEHTKTELIRICRLLERDIAVIPMAYEPRKNLNREQRRKKQILFVGRIEKKKSVDILIRAFSDFLKSKKSGWKLILAGKPGFGYEEIVRLIDKLNLKGRVELSGYISEEEKWRLMSESAFFVHPGAREGSTIPLFEAADAGIPAIAADTPLTRETAGNSVLLFRPGVARDLAEKMLNLSENKILADSLAKKASANLKKLSWTKAAERVLEVMMD